MPKYKVIEHGYIDPKQLKVAPTNVRVKIPPREQLETIINSVREIGVVEPVMINTRNEVVSGQLRVLAAIEAGVDKVPYVKVEFEDEFSEMVACMCQDWIRHSLTAEERYQFVKKARELGYRVQDIAKALGVGESTVWSWLETFERTAPQVRGTPAEKELFKLSARRKQVVDRALRESEMVKDLNKSLQLIEYAREAPLRDLEQATKDIKEGLVVDLETRKKVAKQESVLWEVRIPKQLDTAFREILRKTGKDFLVTIIELIQDFVREHSDKLLED